MHRIITQLQTQISVISMHCGEMNKLCAVPSLLHISPIFSVLGLTGRAGGLGRASSLLFCLLSFSWLDFFFFVFVFCSVSSNISAQEHADPRRVDMKCRSLKDEEKEVRQLLKDLVALKERLRYSDQMQLDGRLRALSEEASAPTQRLALPTGFDAHSL